MNKEGQTQEPVGGMKNVPKKIYLQVDADGEKPEDFNELMSIDISWCSDRIHSNDIEYTLTPPNSPIKTEGEDAEQAAANWQKQNEKYMPDEQSESMLYDSFIAGVEWKSKQGQPVGIDVDHETEKEVMMQAFDKVYKMFQARSWIIDGRGSYPYNDDRYKEEVRYLYDEFEALHKDTWANIKSKSVDFRKKVIEQYKKDLENPYIRLSEAASIPQSSTSEEEEDKMWNELIEDVEDGISQPALQGKFKISKR